MKLGLDRTLTATINDWGRLVAGKGAGQGRSGLTGPVLVPLVPRSTRRITAIANPVGDVGATGGFVGMSILEA